VAELTAFETEVLEALSDYAEVVGPGDTLVIRGHDWWTPDQVLSVHQWLDRAITILGLGFKVILVPGKSLEVEKGEGELAGGVQDGDGPERQRPDPDLRADRGGPGRAG